MTLFHAWTPGRELSGVKMQKLVYNLVYSYNLLPLKLAPTALWLLPAKLFCKTSSTTCLRHVVSNECSYVGRMVIQMQMTTQEVNRSDLQEVNLSLPRAFAASAFKHFHGGVTKICHIQCLLQLELTSWVILPARPFFTLLRW